MPRIVIKLKDCSWKDRIPFRRLRLTDISSARFYAAAGHKISHVYRTDISLRSDFFPRNWINTAHISYLSLSLSLSSDHERMKECWHFFRLPNNRANGTSRLKNRECQFVVTWLKQRDWSNVQPRSEMSKRIDFYSRVVTLQLSPSGHGLVHRHLYASEIGVSANVLGRWSNYDTPGSNALFSQ